MIDDGNAIKKTSALLISFLELVALNLSDICLLGNDRQASLNNISSSRLSILGLINTFLKVFLVD